MDSDAASASTTRRMAGIPSQRWPLRLGRFLMRGTGGTAVVLMFVFFVLAILLLLMAGLVEGQGCDQTPCQEPFLFFAGIAGGGLAFIASLIMLPLAIVHAAATRRNRRNELLAAPRLQALDSWLMAGQVKVPLHGSLKARLAEFSRGEHPSQTARVAGGMLCAFSSMLILVGLAVTGVASVAVSDQNWCSQVETTCTWLKTALVAASTLTVAAVIALVAGIGTAVAGGRGERLARGQFEADWDQMLATARVKG